MKKLLLSLLAAAALGGPAAAQTLFLIGDSTCANKDLKKQNPERGWGQLFQALVTEPLHVENHAVNGRSTKSFRDEGRWDVVCERLREGDYVFIEFGHNDQKINDSTRYADPAQYAENLRRYVRETRERGGRPVLLTPIVRRNWVDGVLTDTHGDYPAQVLRIANEEQVPFIDMELLTRDWVNGLGDEPSKEYFMWVAPGTNPLHPDGRTDDTHLNARGAHVVARLVLQACRTLLPELASSLRNPDLVVAKDGSGDFFTVAEAVAALPDFSSREIWVLVREGLYKEKISVPYTKRFVRMTGDGAERTILSYDGYAGRPNGFGAQMGTSGSSTIYFGADNWSVEDICFENTAGPVGQAVAAQCLGTNLLFTRCRFLGYQDTLYLYGRGNSEKAVDGNSACRFVDCYIEGTIDFIFGSAEAWFEGCEIRSKRDGYISAASTCQGQPRGFVFRRCRLTADEGVDACYLGRPWRAYAKVWFVECEMGSHILPEGWHNWDKPETERTSDFAEYGSTGPGGNLSKRVKWARKLSAREVAGL